MHIYIHDFNIDDDNWHVFIKSHYDFTLHQFNIKFLGGFIDAG